VSKQSFDGCSEGAKQLCYLSGDELGSSRCFHHSLRQEVVADSNICLKGEGNGPFVKSFLSRFLMLYHSLEWN